MQATIHFHLAFQDGLPFLWRDMLPDCRPVLPGGGAVSPGRGSGRQGGPPRTASHGEKTTCCDHTYVSLWKLDLLIWLVDKTSEILRQPFDWLIIEFEWNDFLMKIDLLIDFFFSPFSPVNPSWWSWGTSRNQLYLYTKWPLKKRCCVLWIHFTYLNKVFCLFCFGYSG